MSELMEDYYKGCLTEEQQRHKATKARGEEAVKASYRSGMMWMAFYLASVALIAVFAWGIVSSTMAATDAAFDCAKVGKVAVMVEDGIFPSTAQYVCVNP